MRHVAIIGGGIGGLAAGLALQQRGIAAEVYEAAPQLRPVGAGIWVPSNAMQILERLGQHEAVAAVGVGLERAEVRSDDGALLQGLDFTAVQAARGHTTVSIHRADLQQILANALAPDTLHLDRRCIRFAPDGERVVVDFEDGYQVRADLLVGADGIHSAVRQQLFPEVNLRYAGQTCYRGLSRTPLPEALQRTAREVWGRACRFGFSALGADLVYWFAPISAPADGSDPADGLKVRLLQRYEGFPGPVQEIITGADPQQILRTDLYDFPPIDRWYQGPVVLLGDAAHAMTPNLGQGAAQAIGGDDVHPIVPLGEHHLACALVIAQVFAGIEEFLEQPRLAGILLFHKDETARAVIRRSAGRAGCCSLRRGAGGSTDIVRIVDEAVDP